MPAASTAPRNKPLDRVAYAVVLWLGAWVRPRWAVLQQHREGYGLVWAWLVAGLSVGIIGVVLPALTDWAARLAYEGFNSPLPLILSNAELVVRSLSWVLSNPPELARLAAVVLLGHGLWVVLAWTHLAWSAQPGAPTDALRHALRAVSWASPASVLTLGVLACVFSYWDAAIDAWVLSEMGFANLLPLNPPWWVDFARESQLLLAVLVSLLAYAWLTAAIRAIPWPAYSVWPPRCADCGYSLQGVDARGDCPECGYPVAKSLRPEPLFPPTTPTRHPAFPAFRSWLRLGRLALFNPQNLGRATTLYTHNAGHAASRTITGLALFLTAIAGMLGIRLILGIVDAPELQELDNRTGLVVGYALIPTLVTLTGLAVMQVTSTLAAATYTRKDAGKTLPVAAAFASFGGLYLVAASAALWAFVGLLIALRHTLNPDRFLSNFVTFNFFELSVITVPIVGLLFWAGYHYLIGKALRAARFNNH